MSTEKISYCSSGFGLIRMALAPQPSLARRTLAERRLSSIVRLPLLHYSPAGPRQAFLDVPRKCVAANLAIMALADAHIRSDRTRMDTFDRFFLTRSQSRARYEYFNSVRASLVSTLLTLQGVQRFSCWGNAPVVMIGRKGCTTAFGLRLETPRRIRRCRRYFWFTCKKSISYRLGSPPVERVLGRHSRAFGARFEGDPGG